MRPFFLWGVIAIPLISGPFFEAVVNRMPKLSYLMEFLNKIAPFSLSEEWDNSGLQIGDPEQEIRKILVALDPTMEAIRKAYAIGAGLLLTHHPLIFKSLDQINRGSYPGDVIFNSMEKNIAIVSMHTNLDSAEYGINHFLAVLFELSNTYVLVTNSDEEGTGLGKIGDLSEPINLSDMADRAIEILKTSGITLIGEPDRMIQRVAIMGGSGGDYIKEASAKGADLLITGDLKHHQALEALSLDLALLDGGHFNTEKVAMDGFAGYLQEKLDQMDLDVIVEKFDDEENPMKYKAGNP